MYQRLEQLEAVYEVAPSLFQGEGRNWLASGSEARLVRVQFLRRGQLVEMIATYDTYDGGIEIAFCWVGTQLRPRRMMEKWRDRFSHPYLEYISEAREQERERDHLVEQPDPAFDPTPQLAGYVVIGPDEWGVRQAMDLLPRLGYLRQNAFSWWVAGREVRQVGRRGLVVPNEDRVVDRYEEIHVGEPERVALPARQGRRDDPPAPAALSGVLANRLLGLSEEFDALEEADYVDLADEFRGPVRQTLADLVSGGMLAKVEEVYYLADPAMVYAAGRAGPDLGIHRPQAGVELSQSGYAAAPPLPGPQCRRDQDRQGSQAPWYPGPWGMEGGHAYPGCHPGAAGRGHVRRRAIRPGSVPRRV